MWICIIFQAPDPVKIQDPIPSPGKNNQQKELTYPAKNEQDPLALAALRQSLKLEPENLEAILSLAASFTNESYQAHACHSLQGKIDGHKCC